jgi:hypothetical protein
MALIVVGSAIPVVAFAQGHVANAVIAEQSKIMLPETSNAGPVLWTSNPSSPAPSGFAVASSAMPTYWMA